MFYFRREPSRGSSLLIIVIVGSKEPPEFAKKGKEMEKKCNLNLSGNS